MKATATVATADAGFSYRTRQDGRDRKKRHSPCNF
jgi:hypothetical protein